MHQEIRLYIYTDAAVRASDRAVVSYLLQYVKDGVDAGSREDRMVVDGNQKAATWEAMMDALARISDGNVIPVSIICHCPGVIQAINQEQYIKWQSNGWKNSKGSEIEHAEKWERVVKLMNQKTKRFDSGAFGVKAYAPSEQDAEIMKKLGAKQSDPNINIA